MDEKIFSLTEAQHLIPWVQEVSTEAEQKLRELQQHGDSKESRQLIVEIIHHWAETVYKLGGLPKQPFTVDFNSGTDYFCWEYPEADILYRHSYELGYAGRQRIEDEQ